MSHSFESTLPHEFIEVQNSQPSSAIDSLIAQNEELAVKLRTQLRKTALLESKLAASKQKFDQLTDKANLFEEQILILREKEKSYLSRLNAVESFAAENENLKATLSKQNQSLERHLKYQEKIKLQVKPYIQELKALGVELKNHNDALTTRCQELENQNQVLLQKIEDLKTKVQSQHDQGVLKAQEQNKYFEKEKAALLHLIEDLKMTNQELEKKATLVDLAHFRQNELENKMIFAQSEYIEKIRQIKEESQYHLFEKNKLQAELTQARLEIESLQNQSHNETLKNQQTESRSQNLEKQLSTLREQWNAKQAEHQKLQIQFEALESLNLDLTQRLNLARKGQATL